VIIPTKAGTGLVCDGHARNNDVYRPLICSQQRVIRRPLCRVDYHSVSWEGVASLQPHYPIRYIAPPHFAPPSKIAPFRMGAGYI